MSNLPYADLTRGSLLVASPEIDSGLFFRSVILICDHNETGSFGLVINKPLELDTPSDLLNLDDVTNASIEFRTGGPMQPTQIMLLHTSPDGSSPNGGGETMQVCDGAYLGGDLNFLQTALQTSNGPQVLLCFGYMGWTAGMLEQEFLDGAWFTCPAKKEYIFDTAPDRLWQTVLRDMGGKHATLAMIPDDLSLN